MTEHDRVRGAAACIVAAKPNPTREELLDAICGLQSTDDPSLVPLYNQLLDQLAKMEEKNP